MISADNFERSFSKEEMKKSAEFGSRMDKGMVSMVTCTARLHHPLRNLGEFAVSLDVQLLTRPAWDPVARIAGALVELSLVMRFAETHPVEALRTKEVCSLTVGYGVDGELKQPYEKEEDLQEGLRAFTEIGAVLTCWPMLRETVMTVSSKFGLQPILLPFVRYSAHDADTKSGETKALEAK